MPDKEEMSSPDAVAPLAALVERLAAGVHLPRVGVVSQRPRTPALVDVAGQARAEVRRVLAIAVPSDEGPPAEGTPIAVGVGSRGIAHLDVIVKATVDELASAGFAPFVVPAMGSHGGGTPAGQVEVLEGYGISEATLGVPVRATMETRVVGDIDGLPVHLDRHVAEAGRAFLVARVKPHTDFRGPIESGPTKMAAIGLGKQAGAATLHGLGLGGLRDVMPEAGRLVARRFVLGALAIVENDADETASIDGLTGAEIGGQKEMALLDRARGLLPRIPFADLDVLLVEEIGKDVSGAGMDPNVAGRWLINGLDEPSPLPLKSIVVLDLTDASHGNALGMGFADFTTERLVAKLDPAKMVMNAVTSGWAAMPRARMPIVMPDDRAALIASLASCGRRAIDAARLVWIRNTLDVTTMAVSEALWAEVGEHPELEGVLEPRELPFAPDGRLASLRSLSGGVPAAG